MSSETTSADSPGKPLYVLRSTVWFDELDMVGVLHNARYAIHVERAMTALYHSLTGLDPSDSYVVVKHYEIEFLRPFTRERGELVVEVGLGRLGRTSAVYTFRCLSEGDDGAEVEHARGTRTIVKVTRGDLRPTPWSDGLRAAVTQL
ncbi:MAG TPA: hotdog domain-containing protein [Actinocrinis sp.]|nr:hotdog domain-containing protein [Actinocrinis sp.]